MSEGDGNTAKLAAISSIFSAGATAKSAPLLPHPTMSVSIATPSRLTVMLKMVTFMVAVVISRCAGWPRCR